MRSTNPGILCTLIMMLLGFTAFSQPEYEFRAAWIATVDNIDWPSRGNYDTEKQKQEFIDLLDMHKKNGMNAVIVQVRPATDAFYPSQYEPWSEWLTGKQGRPPFPYYDPLEFMVSETHKRGMEFHAWCNPYRAEHSIGKSSISTAHITRLFPKWFLSYGGKRYFDPGHPEAQKHVVNVIRDIVKRYDIDGMHFDDYFYPYRVAGKEFPDDLSYKNSGSEMSKDDWRRSNVDSIIFKLSRAIKEEKPTVKFGISPFGVWRNIDKDSLGSATKAGVTNYDDLYANVLLWLKEGWIDYVAPQLYWEIGHKAAPYEVLVDWWSKNTYGKHCYIGLGIYRAGSNAAWRDSTLLPRQINMMRSYPEIQGAIYFSSKSFVNNPNGWCDSLQNNYYKIPAMVPPMPWLNNTITENNELPAKPVTSKEAVVPIINSGNNPTTEKNSTRSIK
ncbi:MAG: glycoside hydrolase family 10 protein [Flavitalea sp.]